jgi:ketosteroid isomerase-like protein
MSQAALTRLAVAPFLLAISAPACRGAVPAGASSGGAAMHDVGWLEGRWQTGSDAGGDGGIEHWIRIGDTLHGVGLTARGGRTVSFEVLAVSRVDGVPVYTAMPSGRRMVDFRMREGGEGSAVFANPANDFPEELHYRRTGDALAARLTGRGGGPEDFAWRLGPAGRAAELEDADRAFAAGVAARGLDAWVEWFDAEGAQWRDGPIVGREQIRHLMAPTFARTGFRIEWAPVASGMSPAGDLGYTVGRSRATWMDKDGKPADPYCGVYVTVWRRQQDGRTWRALFDNGWPEPCSAREAS